LSLTRFQSKSSSPDPSAASGAAGRRVHVVTFGCQMNKYDSLLAEGRFRRAGWEVSGTLEDADAVVFNTCSVRDHAEERAWSWIGELKRAKALRPELVIGVMGCMAQRVGEEIFARAGHVDVVAGTRHYHNLPALVERVREARAATGSSSSSVRARDRAARALALEMDDPVAVDRSDEEYSGDVSAWLTVMRGCDLNCAFCIVPTVRGRVLSRPVEDVVREARWLVDRGARAVTLLGQTVNSYGEDFAAPGPDETRHRGRQGRPGLADLIHRLQEIDGLLRIRLITLHPSYLTPELARALRDCDKAERFLPLPAQSGSDRILRAMRRGYTTDLYRRRVDMLRDTVPDVELGSDWIVGFPGETEEDYAASEAFLAEQRFAVNYVFKYDPRPGTSAAERLGDDVDEAVKKERNRRFLAASERVAFARFSRHVDGVRRVFVESVGEREPGTLLGRTIHGLPVSFAGGSELVGRELDVRIVAASAYGLAGEPAAQDSLTT
jgi:tRNA-2-methylthio-N6-dimethylallyladenosine synthase